MTGTHREKSASTILKSIKIANITYFLQNGSLHAPDPPYDVVFKKKKYNLHNAEQEKHIWTVSIFLSNITQLESPPCWSEE